MNKKFDIYKPEFGDTMWIAHCGRPKEVIYDYMWGWIADVDDYDQPHIIIDWTFILFDEFTNDVKEYSSSKPYHEIGFTNKDACCEYCNWKYNGWW